MTQVADQSRDRISRRRVDKVAERRAQLQVIATASTAEELREGFGVVLSGTLREDASLHRLWYDLRNQSLFEESFRADVLEIDQSLERMIWRIVSHFAELAGTSLAVSSPVAYAIFDGLFQQGLLRHLAGQEEAADELRANVEQVLQGLLTPIGFVH